MVSGRLLVFGSFFTVAAGIDALRVRALSAEASVDV